MHADILHARRHQRAVAGAGVGPAVSAYETGVLPLHYPAPFWLNKPDDKQND